MFRDVKALHVLIIGLAEIKGALSIPQASSTSAKLDVSVLILQTRHDNNDSDDDEKVI